MTTYLFAGGGTAGHVNPLLAVADALTARDADATVIVLGTAEGLEARLVPARGYELEVIPKLPFPRRINRASLSFGGRFRRAVATTTEIMKRHSVDVVVGFGGYAAAPAYVAARRAGVPIVIHEANARPGLANRLGVLSTRFVGVAFHGTKLRHSRFVGMPLRREIESIDRDAARAEGIEYFGLDRERKTLLVTGGSLGARRLNTTIAEAAPALVERGWQIVHIVGRSSEFTDPGTPHHHVVEYCDRMELALAVADFAVSRAGAATVSELSALGIPAVYVPYPVGNGEQRYNASDSVHAGGAVLVADADFQPTWVSSVLLPLLEDEVRVHDMAVQSRHAGTLDGNVRMLELIDEATRSADSSRRR